MAEQTQYTKFEPMGRLEDGRWLHVFSQSGLGTADICLERGRLTYNKILPYLASDAAEVGTAMHSGIEYTLDCMQAGEESSLDVALTIAQDTFSEEMVKDNFVWSKANEPTCRRQIELCTTAWWDEVRPDVDFVEGTEVVADQLPLYEDDERVIRINGSVDFLGTIAGQRKAYDWKTAGGKYQPWEKERWSIQPTVYTWILVQLGLMDPDLDEYPFEFIVMLKSGSQRVQRVPVSRHPGDWAWMTEKAVAYAKALEAAHILDMELPKNDTHALCSPTWCDGWSACKGKHYQLEWPKPSLPAVGAPVQIGKTMVPQTPESEGATS